MTWSQRLKRVFNIDIETCIACQGQINVIDCIEDADVIKKILVHLKSNRRKNIQQVCSSKGTASFGIYMS